VFIEGHGIAFELFGVPGHGGRLPFFPARLGWISGVHRMGVRSPASPVILQRLTDELDRETIAVFIDEPDHFLTLWAWS
ncbi:hypothetical protein, partial [Corynebacterium macginleyi]